MKGVTKLTDTGGAILTAGMCLIIAAVSFYAPYGYYLLGEEKFNCFRLAGVVLGLILLPAGIAALVSYFKHGERCLSVIMSFAAAGAVCLSFIFAGDHTTSLWGIDGWRMGFLTQLMIIWFYLLAFLLPVRWKYVFAAAEIISSVVFFMAILNRFGIYPFESMQATAGFLSTIGNIGWFGGYGAVFLPVTIVDCLSGGELCEGLIPGPVRMVMSLIGLSAVATQGSDSSVLMLSCGMFTVMSAVFLGIIGWKKIPGGSMLRTHAKERLRRTGAVICLAVPVIIALFIMFLLGIQVFRVESRGIRLAIRQLTGVKMGDGWGNGRGAIWKLSGRLFSYFSFSEKLFGAGPDGFYGAIYSYPDLAEKLAALYGEGRLTNAHSELLTMLINEGLTGVIAWFGFYGVCIGGFVRRMFRGPDARKDSTSEDAGESGSVYRNRVYALTGLLMMTMLITQQALNYRTVVGLPFMMMLAGGLQHTGSEACITDRICYHRDK